MSPNERLQHVDTCAQGHRKALWGGAATSKKHVFGREVPKKFISTSHRSSLKTWPRIYIRGKYSGVITYIHEKACLAEAKLHWSGFCTDTYTWMCRTWLGGFGGILPQDKKLWKIWCFEMSFLGWKTSLGGLRFSLGMETDSLVPRLSCGRKESLYTLFVHAPSFLGNLHTTPLHYN